MYGNFQSLARSLLILAAPLPLLGFWLFCGHLLELLHLESAENLALHEFRPPVFNRKGHFGVH